MQRTYSIIRDMTQKGHTVLAYDRGIPKCRVRRISIGNFHQRVSLIDDVVYVDGLCASGWTFAKRP